LKDWVTKRKEASRFADVSEKAVQESFRDIAVHVNSRYEAHHAGKFLDGADPWLIAYAQVNDCTVVTGEVLAPGAKKVKIPNICEEFGVDYTNGFTMLQSLSACFILQS